MSAKQWLAENAIKEKAYYYWLSKFQKEACDQMHLTAVTTKAEVAFAKVAMPLLAANLEPASEKKTDGTPVAVIKCNGLTIELSNNISDALLNRLLKEVPHA